MVGNNGEIKVKHPLHKIVGESIDNIEFSDCKIIKDPACGGVHNIPLFCSGIKSNATEYCDVDILILKNKKIRVIIEIEEKTARPTEICGKFLTSALSFYYIHKSENNTPIEMDDSVTFIQIVKAPQTKNSSIPIQYENLEKSIQSILPIKWSKINKYRLIYGTISDFINKNDKKYNELITCIKEALK